MDDSHSQNQPDQRLQKIINHLLGLDSAPTKDYIQALIQEYQLENAQFYTADQKQFLKHYATNYAQFEKNKFDTSTHKGLLHQLFHLGKLAIEEHFSDHQTAKQIINDYLELHTFLNQILTNEALQSMISDFHFRKIKQITAGQPIDDEQLADDAIDQHYKDNPEIKDYLSTLSEDQVKALGETEVEIARNVRSHLAKSIPSLDITLFPKPVDNHFHFSHQSQLSQPLFILLMRKLVPVDNYPEKMSWNNFLKTQAERAITTDLTWTPVPLLPGLSTTDLSISTVIDGFSLVLNFLDPGIGTKFPLLTGISFRLDRVAQKSLILESDRVFSGDEVYLERALFQRSINELQNRLSSLAQYLNIADVLDRILFDISAQLPHESLNHDRNREHLLLASKAVRFYDKIEGLKESLSVLKSRRTAEKEPFPTDYESYLQADELYFHPDQKSSGLVDIFDTIKLLTTSERTIIDPFLKTLGVMPVDSNWEKFIQSGYWQKMVQDTQSIAILPTIIPGMDLVIDPWNGVDPVISIRINRLVRRSLVLMPPRATLFGATDASQLDKMKNKASILEEEIAIARKKLPNIALKIPAPGLWGLLGRKVLNPNYQALSEQINQAEAELESLKTQIVDIS